MATGRYKLGPDGAYFDPNDGGPDQASPEQIQQLQGQTAPQSPAPTESSQPYPDTQAAPAPSGDSSPLESQMYQMNDSQLGGQPADSSGALPSPYSTDIHRQTTDYHVPQPTTATSTASPTTQRTVPEGTVPDGFDATKWNDPNKHDPKYDVGKLVASGATNEQVQAMLDQSYPGWKVTGKDIITDPQGNRTDFRYDQEGANRPMWEGVGGAGGTNGSVAGAAGVGGVGPNASGGAGGYGSGPIADAISRLLGRGEASTSPTDPNIAGPTAAYRAAQDRETRRSRNALAERAAAEGLNNGGQGSGAFDSAIQSQQESEGINVANYQGQLMTKEIAAKRQDVVNALQFAQGQEKIALEQYLAQLNDQLLRAQMSQQNSQFYDTMGYNMGRDSAELDARMLSYLQ